MRQAPIKKEASKHWSFIFTKYIFSSPKTEMCYFEKHQQSLLGSLNGLTHIFYEQELKFNCIESELLPFPLWLLESAMRLKIQTLWDKDQEEMYQFKTLRKKVKVLLKQDHMKNGLQGIWHFFANSAFMNKVHTIQCIFECVCIYLFAYCWVSHYIYRTYIITSKGIVKLL